MVGVICADRPRLLGRPASNPSVDRLVVPRLLPLVQQHLLLLHRHLCPRVLEAVEIPRQNKAAHVLHGCNAGSQLRSVPRLLVRFQGLRGAL